MDWCNETKVDDRSSLCPTNRRAMMDYGIHTVRVDFYLYIYPFAPLCQLPTDVASQRLSFSGSNLFLPSFMPKYRIFLKFLWEFSYTSLSILYFTDPKRNSRKEEKEDENDFVRVKQKTNKLRINKVTERSNNVLMIGITLRKRFYDGKSDTIDVSREKKK